MIRAVRAEALGSSLRISPETLGQRAYNNVQVGYNSLWKQSGLGGRSGSCDPGRKVRTGQGTVMANGHRQ